MRGAPSGSPCSTSRALFRLANCSAASEIPTRLLPTTSRRTAARIGAVLGGLGVALAGLAFLKAVLAMWTAAVFILATTLAARTVPFPGWLVRLGFAAAVFVFLLGSSVMGVLGVPVWAFAVGIHWFRRGSDVRDIRLQPEEVGLA